MALEERVKEIAASLRGHAAAVFLWGSHATGEAHARSDVDLCVVVGPDREPREVFSAMLRHLQAPDLDIDAKVFEDLPLFLKGAVIEHGRLLWAEDPHALDDYLWRWRKLWRDARVRHDVDPDDIRRALARG